MARGWSGHFKGQYFRSLLELSYLKYLDDNKIQFESGELRKHGIEYKYRSKIHNYYTDFYLIQSDEYIEIKPASMVDEPKNKAKFAAARAKHGDRFHVVTDETLTLISQDELKVMCKSGDVVLIKRYAKRLKKKGRKKKK